MIYKMIDKKNNIIDIGNRKYFISEYAKNCYRNFESCNIAKITLKMIAKNYGVIFERVQK